MPFLGVVGMALTPNTYLARRSITDPVATGAKDSAITRAHLDQTAAMLIREIDRGRRGAAVEIWSAAGLTRPWNEPNEDFDRAVDGPTSAVLGALEDDALIGTVMVGHDGHRGWVYYLAVSLQRQGQGVGQKLMDAAESWLAERGAVKLNLMVRHANIVALGFYERLGYTDAEVTVLAKWLKPRPTDEPPV
jgi:ribosomal protein S18 acetylase RimI-like enzyme